MIASTILIAGVFTTAVVVVLSAACSRLDDDEIQQKEITEWRKTNNENYKRD